MNLYPTEPGRKVIKGDQYMCVDEHSHMKGKTFTVTGEVDKHGWMLCKWDEDQTTCVVHPIDSGNGLCLRVRKEGQES